MTGSHFDLLLPAPSSH